MKIKIFFDDNLNMHRNNCIKLSYRTLKIKWNNLNLEELNEKLKTFKIIIESPNLTKRLDNLKIKITDRYKTFLKKSNYTEVYGK